MLFLKERHSLSSLCSDAAVGAVAISLKERFCSNLSVLEEYLTEARNLRQDLAEATELSQLVRSQKRERPSTIVDVGCGHGLLSLALTADLGVQSLVWVDRDTSCRAARFASRLQLSFYKTLEETKMRENCLVLAVNVCSQSLLDVIAWYLESSSSGWMVCVPCCGFPEMEYEDWLNRVEAAFGSSSGCVVRTQLRHNLGRTALSHCKKPN